MGTDSEDDDASKTLKTASSAESVDGESPLNKRNALQLLRRVDTPRKQELLFASWDFNRDGFVDFADIQEGLSKLQPTNDEIHLEFVAEAALKALPALATPDKKRLNFDGFKAFVDSLMKQMGQPLGIVSELLILCGLQLQPKIPEGSALATKIKESTRASHDQRRRMKELSQDSRMVKLFHHFNKSGSGCLDFAELSHMLWSIRQGVPLRQARAEAVDTMLLLDTNSERSVNILEFSRFIHKLAMLLHMDARLLAEAILPISQSSGLHTPTPDDEEIAQSMRSADCTAQMYATLADRKMHLLFELWDKDGDRCISFAELALGLRKLSPAQEPLADTASDAAEAMLIFDADSDQNLNRAEFARFINAFCEGCEADFNTLSEFLILLAAMEDNPSEELAFLLAKDKIDRAIAGLDASWQAEHQGAHRAADRGDGKETPADTQASSQPVTGVTEDFQKLGLGDGKAAVFETDPCPGPGGLRDAGPKP